MSLQARTQGLSLTVEDALRGTLALGQLEAEGVVLGTLPPEFEQERDQLTARLSARYAGKPATDIPGVAVEDEVVLLGSQGGERIAAEQLAAWCGTISYEVVSRIHPAIPRVVVPGAGKGGAAAGPPGAAGAERTP